MTETEVEILTADEIKDVMLKLEGHWLYPIAVLALATGMRRGELLALSWENVTTKTLCIDRSLEQTKDGLRFKSPKTVYGRGTLSLPHKAISVLRAHHKQQLETYMALGQGRPELVFMDVIKNAPIPPNNLSRDWRRISASRRLPRVSFHALGHTHASALIASGHDPVAVSRNLGHARPVITMKTYAHLFAKPDHAASAACDAVLG